MKSWPCKELKTIFYGSRQVVEERRSRGLSWIITVPGKGKILNGGHPLKDMVKSKITTLPFQFIL